MKRIYKLISHDVRLHCCAEIMKADLGHVVRISEGSRTLDQNAAQWPILQAFSEQLEWPVNGAMVKLSDGEWKDILTAGFRQEQPRLAQGIDGGMVMLGQRTSKFSKAEFSDWLEYLHMVAATRGVEVYSEVEQCEF